MAEEVHLDGRDAANLGRYLTALANLIDPEIGPPYQAHQLTEAQRRLLAENRAISARPSELADILRKYVANIYAQLGDDAAEL